MKYWPSDTGERIGLGLSIMIFVCVVLIAVIVWPV